MAKAKPTAKPKATPTKSQKRRVTFALTAPEAQAVAVTGNFCDWLPDVHMLKRDGKGTWKKMMMLEPGRYEYRFVVDGHWWDDQACMERVANSYGTHNCILLVE